MKYTVYKLAELVNALQYDGYETEESRKSEILEIFDEEFDGDIESGTYPQDLDDAIRPHIDKVKVVLSGFEMSENHWGGDDIREFADAIFGYIAEKRFKYAYTYYNDNTDIAVILSEVDLSHLSTLVNITGEDTRVTLL